MPVAAEASQPHRTAPLREVRVLQALACAPPGTGISLRECVEATGIPRASCHRMLRALCEGGYAERLTRGRFGPGWRFHLLGRGLTARADLLPVAQPFLERLAWGGLSAHLGCLDGADVVLLDCAEGSGCPPVHRGPGSRLPAQVCALGWAIAASLPSAATPAWAAPLARELREVRRLGYALDAGRSLPEWHCVAAAIRDPRHGRAHAAIGVKGLGTLVQPILPALIEAVKASAAHVSGKLSRG